MATICDELKKKNNGRIVQPITVDESRYNNLSGHPKTMIKAWFDGAYAKINSDQPVFDPFMHCWMAFNAWASCVTGVEGDADIINALIHHTEFNDLFDRMIAGQEQPFYEKTTDFAAMWPIFKATDAASSIPPDDIAHDRKAVVQNYLNSGLADYQPICYKTHAAPDNGICPVDWPHTLRAIYRVRCNLFHGWKFDMEMDRKIVGLSFQVLGRFLKAANIFQ